MSSTQKVDRRKFLKYAGATIVAAGVVGGAGYYLTRPPVGPTPTETITMATESPTVTPTETLAAKRLNLIGTVEAHCYAKKEIGAAPDGDYFKKTGTEVVVEQFPYDPTHEREVLELSTKSPTYDIVCSDNFWVPEYSSAGWLWQLDELHSMYPDVPEIDWNGVSWIGSHEWYKHYAAHNDLCVVLMAYRKDLFEKYGVTDTGGKPKIPVSWDDYKTTIKDLTRDGNYGAVYHLGGRDAGYTDWLVRRQGMTSGKGPTGVYDYVVDDKWNPIFNDSKGVEALEMLIEDTKYAVPGYLGIDYPEAIAAYQNGKAATFITWSVLMFEFDKADVAPLIVGKSGYAPPPYSEEPHFIPGGWHMGVNKASKNPKEAYRFISYIISAEGQQAMLNHGAVTAYRKEFLEDPKWIAKYPVMEAVPKLKNPYPFTITGQWVEMQRIIYEGIAAAISGKKKPQQALDDASDEVHEVLKKAGYYQ